MFAQLAAHLNAYVAAGFAPNVAAGWANMGFMPNEAARWVALGVTSPAEADRIGAMVNPAAELAYLARRAA